MLPRRKKDGRAPRSAGPCLRFNFRDARAIGPLLRIRSGAKRKLAAWLGPIEKSGLRVSPGLRARRDRSEAASATMSLVFGFGSGAIALVPRLDASRVAGTRWATRSAHRAIAKSTTIMQGAFRHAVGWERRWPEMIGPAREVCRRVQDAAERNSKTCTGPSPWPPRNAGRCVGDGSN